MKDKVLRCQDCCNHFVFTVKQQQNYQDRGWTDPIRCPSCRARKKEIWQTNEDYKKLTHGGPMRLYSRHGRGFFKKLGG